VLNLPSVRQTFQASITAALEKGHVKEGDLVVMTAGTLQNVSGSTDLIKVELVTAVMGQGVGIGQGAVSGRARIASGPNSLKDFHVGEILVAARTEAMHVDAIRKAAAIITEDGDRNGHAAVLGLRLGIPVIVGVESAMELIRDGTILTLDIQKGLVYSGSFDNYQKVSDLLV
jgi:pyruvate kinase